MIFELPTLTVPKSVESETVGVASPSEIDTPFPLISISGLSVPVPLIENVYGFSSPSSFAIVNVATLSPVELGSKVT